MNKKILSMLSVICLIGFLFGCGIAEEPIAEKEETPLLVSDNLEVHFLDVGQADATLLVNNGHAMMIDTGNCDDSIMILNTLSNMGIDKLDFIIFTHPHEDHIGSGKSIMENLPVDTVYMLSGYDEGIALNLKETIEGKGIAVVNSELESVIAFEDCQLEFVGPVSSDYADPNDNSISIKVTHGYNALLFTGDAGSGPEKDMVNAGFDLEVDLLHAGHHGSKTSNSYYFLRALNPKYVVISCGLDNMYGHPDEDALSRFNDVGAVVYRTDSEGSIIATSDGENINFNVEGKEPTREHTDIQEEACFIGNLNSKKFHLSTCSQLPYEENSIYFAERETAIIAQ